MTIIGFFFFDGTRIEALVEVYFAMISSPSAYTILVRPVLLQEGNGTPHPPTPTPNNPPPPTPNWWCGSLSHKFNSLHSPPFSSPLLPHCLIPSSPPPQVCWPPSFNYLASWFLFSTPIWVVQQKVGTRDTFVDWAAVRHIYVMICRFFLLVDCFCVRLHKERIDEMDPLISCHLMPCRHGPADLWVDL